jgi:kanamycin kinase
MLESDFEPGLEAEFLDAYGIDADEERMAYYRARWEA